MIVLGADLHEPQMTRAFHFSKFIIKRRSFAQLSTSSVKVSVSAQSHGEISPCCYSFEGSSIAAHEDGCRDGHLFVVKAQTQFSELTPAPRVYLAVSCEPLVSFNIVKIYNLLDKARL